MNSDLTRPQSIQELYKTYFSYANKFRFTDLLKNYVQSEEWKDKSQEQVWGLISRISDDIGAVLTDDIVNYTRNVVDVNTCKVPQLIEHAKMLSYGLDHIKNAYDFFPKRIQCLIDIFSINPEYLLGNHKNHILSDEVVKEILIYIRENTKDRTPFTNEDVIDNLIENPHSLADAQTYRNFVQTLFYQSIVDALSAPYHQHTDSDPGDTIPIAFNVLWEERLNQKNILLDIENHKSWVDRYIWNEIEHPLNDKGLPNTIYDTVERLKNQKRISPRFNPFKIADHIWFNGLSPTNGLTQDEMGLVQDVLDYHARTMYDYENGKFTDDQATQYAYYRELEWCEYVKMSMFVQNNLKSFNMQGLSYDPMSNKFIQSGIDQNSCLKVVELFSQGDSLVDDGSGKVVLNQQTMLDVSDFLCRYAFHLQAIRENMKTIAQKHAMRGSAALLVHIVNDYLIKELPIIRDMIADDVESEDEVPVLGWEIDESFRNHGNVKVLEYMDDNEYFNIDPEADIRFTGRTNERYWERLSGMGMDDSLGVLTKRQIYDFYKNTLGMGRLQPRKPRDYDYIQDFLVDLFKIGANPIEWRSDEGEFYNPIDDIISKSEEDYGYTKQERLDVQTNTQLRRNQERQFKEYSGRDDLIGNGMYEYVNNRLFYWKNVDYSSHVLHPFMYNLKLWNRLDNIIINGYKDYVNSDLIDYLSSKMKFDEMFGKYGEGKNFWKYNIMDLTGYTTRYEAAVKDEHKDDGKNTISELTGYDGLFYPEAAREFLDVMKVSTDFSLTQEFFKHSVSKSIVYSDGSSVDVDNVFLAGSEEFLAAVYSIYWQEQKTVLAVEVDGKFYQKSESDSFYTRWYSHLNYTRAEYQKIAMQLWYWRDRIKDVMTTTYPIKRYCLDIQGNSLILVSTFKEGEQDADQFLIDLILAQNGAQSEICGNKNEHVAFCGDGLVLPSEFWIRWKSNPIAVPAFDAKYDMSSDDAQFDIHYRNSEQMVEMGQLTHTNSSCNDLFKVVLDKWREQYGSKTLDDNRLPVFFDMEQSANVLALASWDRIKDIDEDGIVHTDEFGNQKWICCCSKNPLHIVSYERTGQSPSEYQLEAYADNDAINASGQLQRRWLFDAYHYCQANGSILVPLYNFDCSDEPSQKSAQKVSIRMFSIVAQTLKNQSHSTSDRIYQLQDITVDLNEKIDFGSDKQKHRFDAPIKVCRNTNLVFSPYDDGGMNKVRCAFLGTYVQPFSSGSYKVSSCDAMTRYEFDSQSAHDLSLLKGRYHQGGNDRWEGVPDGVKTRRYLDSDISYNSYDSNDKYVFLIDFQPSIDQKMLFDMSSMGGIQTSSYNILCDAGCIPHFAYQSLLKYDPSDPGGVACTFRNQHLKGKTHMQFELLGLDSRGLGDIYKAFQKMVVDDLADDCKTLLCPAKMMDDIYRIWCETATAKANAKDPYDSYFANEYKEWINEAFDFGDSDEYVWEIPKEEGFEIEVPDGLDLSSSDNVGELLDDYYVSVFRTEDGEILNERRYLLQPTPISRFVMNLADQDDGHETCSLSKYQTSLVKDNHYVPTQVMFVGTPDPFHYDEKGERVYSRAEELQYGNSIRGVDGIQIAIDVIVNEQQRGLKFDANDQVIRDGNGVPMMDDPEPTRRYLVPKVKFLKKRSANPTSLVERIQNKTTAVSEGQVKVVISHRNLDNIAKYHILNRSSNLYFYGSLPKNGRNQFKFSDFKYDFALKLEETEDGWKSTDTDDDGNPLIEFDLNDVQGQGDDGSLPPWFIMGDNGEPEWYLEQHRRPMEFRKYDKDGPWKEFKDGDSTIDEDGRQAKHFNGMAYPVPVKGDFIRAYHVKAKAERYLDYLYIANGGLSFKVSEESQSFSDAMTKIPPFHIDEATKNKLADLNDVQILKDYSTFIHQSEDPEKVKDCSALNPVQIDAALKYGLEQRELWHETKDMFGKTMFYRDRRPSTICTEDGREIVLDNFTQKTRLSLQLEDGEIDDYLKIYANYVRVPDKNGDWHYDLYFNVQNLFNSPFEYISAVTGQANVLILPDSYLCLSGDKWKEVYDENGRFLCNEIDDDKMRRIRQGGTLSIYGQAKTYSNDQLSDVKTIRLFTYQIYNISDDKPKFLINKTYDITQSSLANSAEDAVKIEFSDVMWTIEEDQFSEDIDKKFKELKEDIVVVQPVNVRYNYDPNDDYRINQVQFDIVSDVIDFNNVPRLMDYSTQERALVKGVDGWPYYDRWSDRYMKLDLNSDTGNPRLTLKWDADCGFNFETIYLRWILPKGCRIMDTVDRLGGYVLSSTADNIVSSTSNVRTTPKFEVKTGHIAARVHGQKKMYLGLEHSTTARKSGYVLTGLADAVRNAILSNAITEDDIKNKAKEN